MADAPEDAEEWTAPYAQPDYYDGAATQPLMDWIFRMELFLRAAGIAEDSTGAVDTAATYLKDEAVTWWRYLSERVVGGWEPAVLTWAAFTTALIARFRVVDDGRNARLQLYYLCQTGSVQTYTQEFERLLLDTPETHELDRIFNYIMGLEWNVRAAVERGHPSTWLQAIQLADRADNLLNDLQPLAADGYEETADMELGAESGWEVRTMTARATRPGARAGGARRRGRRPRGSDHLAPSN